MAISPNLEDREQAKFVESPSRPGFTAVEVFGSLSTGTGPFSVPMNCFCYTEETGIDGIYFTEIFKFYESGTPAAPINLIKTITLYYSDSNRSVGVGGTSG